MGDDRKRIIEDQRQDPSALPRFFGAPVTERDLVELLQSRNGCPTLVTTWDGERMRIEEVREAPELDPDAVDFQHFSALGGIPLSGDDCYFFYSTEVVRIDDVGSGAVLYTRRSSGEVPAGALFVAADEPLLVFPSAAAAERHLEAVDVRNGVYPLAYGPEGQPYSVCSDGDSVLIEPIGGPDRPEELKTLLLRYLDEGGHVADAGAPLATLVAEVWKIESASRGGNGHYGDWGCVAFISLLLTGLYFLFW